MTRKSLASAINRFQTGNRKKEWFVVGVLFAGLISAVVFQSNFPAAFANPRVGQAFCGGIFLWIVAAWCILGRMNKARIKQLNLRCPSCNVSLASYYGRLAVTTLHCAHCGAKIVEEDAGSDKPE